MPLSHLTTLKLLDYMTHLWPLFRIGIHNNKERPSMLLLRPMKMASLPVLVSLFGQTTASHHRFQPIYQIDQKCQDPTRNSLQDKHPKTVAITPVIKHSILVGILRCYILVNMREEFGNKSCRLHWRPNIYLPWGLAFTLHKSMWNVKRLPFDHSIVRKWTSQEHFHKVREPFARSFWDADILMPTIANGEQRMSGILKLHCSNTSPDLEAS